MFLTATLIWAVGFALFVASIYFAKPQQPNTKTDAIIVLTGGEKRIETGLSLFADNMAPDLFITGVYPSVKKKDIVKQWTGEKPLPVCCITLGHAATTTVQNAHEAQEWAEEHNIKSIRLVTSDFHINRAMIEFRNEMPDMDIIPHPFKQENATPDKLWFWIISLSEYNKTLIRWAQMMLSAPNTSHH